MIIINVIKKEVKKILKYTAFAIEIQHVECTNRSYTSNNRGNWKHL